jgi:hypothetical protein
MDINDRLYVEIHPLAAGQIPHPHPIDEAKFDPAYVYKVLGMYNPSETSECFMVLANTQRQIWFIPQRHLLAFGLVDSDEMFLSLEAAEALKKNRRRVTTGPFPGEDRPTEHNGHASRLPGLARSSS